MISYIGSLKLIETNICFPFVVVVVLMFSFCLVLNSSKPYVYVYVGSSGNYVMAVYFH